MFPQTTSGPLYGTGLDILQSESGPSEMVADRETRVFCNAVLSQKNKYMWPSRLLLHLRHFRLTSLWSRNVVLTKNSCL